MESFGAHIDFSFASCFSTSCDQVPLTTLRDQVLWARHLSAVYLTCVACMRHLHLVLVTGIADRISNEEVVRPGDLLVSVDTELLLLNWVMLDHAAFARAMHFELESHTLLLIAFRNEVELEVSLCARVLDRIVAQVCG